VQLSEFDFELPQNLIAQMPAARRDEARMMVVRRDTGRCEHLLFRDLPQVIGREHFLVMNNTRVFPARLRACRPDKQEHIEVLLVRDLGSGDWLALLKPGRKAMIGQELRMGPLGARVKEIRESGARVLHFPAQENLMATFETIGQPPLPPYIHRWPGQDLAQDRTRYQTVYARHTGSVAAPTAGLHFSEEILHRLDQVGVPRCEILLHIGYGTFQPVRCKKIEDHPMEPEYFEVSEKAAESIGKFKQEGRRLVAVGTTTTRVLEYLALQKEGFCSGKSGFCNLFIYPGFEFRMLDGLLTNFHLPQSTLFILVCAFGGIKLLQECYREAIRREYRFYSYGDCMLLL
jgi:S-adenosylmethionine:tRNA ribosyltransferase-isomerase